MATSQQIKQALEAYFNVGELNTLCFDLGFPFEDIKGDGKTETIIALIGYAGRMDRTGALIEYINKARPHARLSPVAADEAAPPPTNPSNLPNPANPSNPPSIQYHFHGQVVGSAIGGGQVRAEHIAGRDIIIGQVPQSREEFYDQLAALRQLLTEAIANKEIPDERDAADALEDVENALAEAEAAEPRASRLKRYLEGAAEILQGAAKATTAAGKAGLAVLKAAPIAAALVKAIQVLF